jgi:F0F1-type ATP synthase membrane subunit c/vacuolar-type H+-ATPase subunit K
MPAINPAFFTSLRRGAVGFARGFRPAVPVLAYGGVALAAGYAGKEVLDAWARKDNPPAQVGTIPYTNPHDITPGTPEPNDGMRQAGYFFDPRTGRTFFFGDAPHEGSGPERSEERVDKTLILAGAAAVVGIAFILAGRGK